MNVRMTVRMMLPLLVGLFLVWGAASPVSAGEWEGFDFLDDESCNGFPTTPPFFASFKDRETQPRYAPPRIRTAPHPDAVQWGPGAQEYWYRTNVQIGADAVDPASIYLQVCERVEDRSTSPITIIDATIVRADIWNTGADTTGRTFLRTDPLCGRPPVCRGVRLNGGWDVVAEGISFVHVAVDVRNADGSLSRGLIPLTDVGQSYRPLEVRIDKTAPSLTLGDFDGSPSSVARTALITAIDALSGVNSVTCIDNGRAITVTPAGADWRVSVNGGGTHTVVCTAKDRAGNATSASKAVVIGEAAVAWLNSGPIQFGRVTVGNPHCSVQSINIRNSGNAGLTIDRIAIGGANASDFTITNGTGPITLGVQQTYAILVRFCPTVEGARTATLTLSGGNVPGGSVSIGLIGTGAPR